MRIIRSAIGALVLATGLAAGSTAQAHDATTGSATGATTGTTTSTTKTTTTKKTQGSMSAADKKFLADAYGSASSEVAIGKLASERGSTDAVKSLGKKIADDNSRQLDELKKLVQKDNMEAPKSATIFQGEVKRLSKLSGPEFDKAFLAHERGHEKAMLGEFQRQAKAGKNADLQKFASTQITVLRSHIDQAHNLGVTNVQPSGKTPKIETPKLPKMQNEPKGETNKQPEQGR
jgi:putative membrane protein